jgi:hypothetical protein
VPNEIIIDITTGFIVLGSVFGVSHLRKIRKKIRERTRFEGLRRKPPQAAAPIATAEQEELRSRPPGFGR